MTQLDTTAPRRILFGITGASGIAYARVLLAEMLKLDVEVHLIVSPSALIVMREELGITFTDGRFSPAEFLGVAAPDNRIILHDNRNIAAGPASGSFRVHGMVICPCSMKTLATIAHGTGESLITRAADACLKERRRLVLVPRETPLSLVHLRNMVSVTEAGAIVLPAMPGFYKQPQSIEDLLRHVALKALDALSLEHRIELRWKDTL